MATQLLMPKATAVWLVENTALTFDQIAEFCALHPLEVQAIADGDAAVGVKGFDPIQSGQLSRDQIAQAEGNDKLRLKLQEPKVKVPNLAKKGPRYTPVSKRQDRPNAIYWLVRNHPELKDPQISKLVGTTKTTIQAIRDGSHWNRPNLEPVDPVALGFCSQIELDFEVAKAEAARPQSAEGEPTDTLMPASQTELMRDEAPVRRRGEIDADSVFANFAAVAAEETKQD